MLMLDVATHVVVLLVLVLVLLFVPVLVLRLRRWRLPPQCILTVLRGRVDAGAQWAPLHRQPEDV